MIKIWSPAGQNLATFRDNGREVTSLAWSSDSTRIASADVEGIVRIWNTSTNQIVKTFAGHTDIADSVVWSPDETRLATGSQDKTVRIWDVETGQTINTIQVNDYVFAVAWSPNGNKIAYGVASGQLQITTVSSMPIIPTPPTRQDF